MTVTLNSPLVSPPALLPEKLFQTPLINEKGLVHPIGVWGKFFGQVAKAAQLPQSVKETHAKRLTTPASSYPDGSRFFETDRGIEYIARGKDWNYSSGIFSCLQAALPTDLTTTDAGFLVNVSDFAHLLEWTGAGWTWGPGENGSDHILVFLTGPTPATGWQLCDGSSGVASLNSDGSLAFVSVPDLTISAPGSWYRQ